MKTHNKTNQNKTNQSDRQIKGAAGDMANQQLNSNQSATSQQTVSHRQPISNSQQRVNSEAIPIEEKIAARQELLDITPASDQKRRGEIRKEIETLRSKRQQMAQSAANQQAARMPKVNTTYVSGQADDSDVPEF